MVGFAEGCARKETSSHVFKIVFGCLGRGARRPIARRVPEKRRRVNGRPLDVDLPSLDQQLLADVAVADCGIGRTTRTYLEVPLDPHRGTAQHPTPIQGCTLWRMSMSIPDRRNAS